jgi:hypothetical protein
MSKPTRPGKVLRIARDDQGRKLAEVFVSTGWLRPRQFYYRILGGNAEIMASSEGYVTLSGASDGCEDLVARIVTGTYSRLVWHNVA